jgi:NADH-quinone oxidoreductase subunit K
MYYLFLAFILFIIGTFGMFLSRKHVIIILISLEILLLSINIIFVVSAIFFDDISGQIYSLFVLAVAASESALGLSILVIYYRLRGGISVDLITLLKA